MNKFSDDRCYECTANGDDYYLDGNNEWVKACDDCPYSYELEEELDNDWK